MQENTIKKIFSGKFDQGVHEDFIKYSRGLFSNKFLLQGKKQGDKWAIKTSAEYVNYIVRGCLEKANGNVKIKGAIISTLDMKASLPFEIIRVKQFMGIKQLLIDSESKVSDLLALMDKFPRAFYALTFSFPGGDLKVKAKAPKSAKPAASGDKEVAPDFCTLKTTDQEIVKDLFFLEGDFKEASVNHSFEIKEIILPKGEKDPLKMRENAKRKGIMKRIIEVDGKKEIKEANFEA
jgi:hypothetical protein